MENKIRVNVVWLELFSVHIKFAEIPCLRQAIALALPEYDIIHNHLKRGKFRYSYPQVQFKIVKNVPIVLGVNRGIRVVKKIIKDVKEVRIGERNFRLWEFALNEGELEFGQTEEVHTYRFASPWMALNQENYQRYRSLSRVEQHDFLNHLLRENLKSLAKGFKYWIPDIEQIVVDGEYEEIKSKFKGNKMVCFWGEFRVNFAIPQFLGIGKQVARGYGVVLPKDFK